MEDIKVNITTENKELVILTGQAEPVIKPVKVDLNGSIDAPSEYFTKRITTIPVLNSHLEVNREAKSIKLIVGDDVEKKTTVTGTAKLFKDFSDMGINADKTYTLESLAKMIKFKGCYFKDRNAHVKLITNLMNFKVKIEQDFSNSNDFKGSAANAKATNIKHEIPLDFVLNIPVLMGQPAQEIKVEVCIDASNGSVELWLESIDLKSQMDTTISELIEKEVAKFNNQLVVIVVG